MHIGVFSSHDYDRKALQAANTGLGHELTFFDCRLSPATVGAARGIPAVSVFVNDQLDAEVLERLHEGGTRLVALRCTGFNNVDLRAAQRVGMHVVRVPAYSPDSVAEFTLALILCLRRKVHRAYVRVREGNFSLEGLLGLDLRHSTVGIVGTGRIGTALAGMLSGFGVRVLATDPIRSACCLELGVQYVELPELLAQSDVVSLHCPLTPQTHHLINAKALAQMRPGAMLVNTSRGAVVDTRALVAVLKCRHLGALALDVYEQEGDLFFENLSEEIIQDDVFERLLTFPNVLVTGHLGFFTERALSQIATTTLANLTDIERRGGCANEVTAAQVMGSAAAHQETS